MARKIISKLFKEKTVIELGNIEVLGSYDYSLVFGGGNNGCFCGKVDMFKYGRIVEVVEYDNISSEAECRKSCCPGAVDKRFIKYYEYEGNKKQCDLSKDNDVKNDLVDTCHNHSICNIM